MGMPFGPGEMQTLDVPWGLSGLTVPNDGSLAKKSRRVVRKLYREPGKGLQNIAKQDPGRVRRRKKVLATIYKPFLGAR